MIGYIHSTESFGTVDGPGVRFVVFMQGCPMRCLYCHNPDTWELKRGRELEPADIMELYRKNKQFYSNGGLTVTGGEPLVQLDFLIELFELAKREGVHTCLDTSGATFLPDNNAYLEKLDRLLENTDLVMLDLKHIDPEKHRRLTGLDNDRVLAFARYLDAKGITIWVRHTVVAGYTDSPEDLLELGRFVGTLRHVKELSIEYPLAGIEALPKEAAVTAKAHIMEGIRQVRRTLDH